MSTLKKQFEKNGFCVARSILNEQEVKHYRSLLKNISKIEAENFKKGFSQNSPECTWQHCDGVTQRKEFWDLIFHQRLLETIKTVLGPEIKFMQHNDLQVGYSSVAWHRDSRVNDYGPDEDWQEEEEKYQIVRVGIYLQSFKESQFRLGLLPKTNKYESKLTAWERKLAGRWKELKGFVKLFYRIKSKLLWQNLITKPAIWVKTEPGDCVIFDPRILHCGSHIIGPKYSMFVAYAIVNSHSHRYHKYFLHERKDLNYAKLAPELVEKLKKADLYAEEVLPD